jgi:hypothetical protein
MGCQLAARSTRHRRQLGTRVGRLVSVQRAIRGFGRAAQGQRSIPTLRDALRSRSRKQLVLRDLPSVLAEPALKVGEAFALSETDLEPARGALTNRPSWQGGRRREVGMAWGWEHLGRGLSVAVRFRSGRSSA